MAHIQQIETDRLLLRPFTEADVDASYQMNLDAEVSRYTHDGGVVSREEIYRRITEHVMGDYEKYGYGRMAVEVKGGPAFIGFCGLKYLDDYQVIDLGYRLMSQYWGKGYATEAAAASVDNGFNNLPIENIEAFALPKNSGSIRVLEKLHFHKAREVIEDGARAFQYTLKEAVWKSQNA